MRGLRDKASVLHDAADELQRLRAELVAARAREERQRVELSSLACICRLDGLRTLHGSSLLRSRLCVVLLSEARVLLDVSEALVESTGWPRSRLQGSRLGREGDKQLVTADEACPLWVQYSHAHDKLTHLGQYPSTKAAVRELFAGHMQRVDVPFRVYTADGRTVEMPCLIWQANSGQVDEQGCLHCHVVITWAMDDCLDV